MHPAVKTVFFHELGHLIARELNLKNFGVMGATKEIVIYPSKHPWRDYDGATIPLIPEGEEPDKPVVSIAEKLAVIPYGCFVEAIFLKKDFETCFSSNNGGGKDLDNWATLRMKALDSKSLYQHVKDHFSLLTASNAFDELFKIDVESYLVEEEGKYTVDLDKLKNLIKDFLSKHEELYLPFVEKIREFLPKQDGCSG
ncbi:MAG: hypothetical protein V4615_04155 [Bacteroidota bacterium]